MRAIVSAVLFSVSLLSVLGLMSAPSYAAPQKWDVVVKESVLGFTGTQMAQPFKGRFINFSANVFFDPDALSGSVVDVIIPISSFRSNNSERDAWVRGPDWFDAANNPTARFTAKEFAKAGPTSFEARGRLTLRRTTRDVVLPFTLVIDGDTAKMSATLTIDRVDYGIGMGAWASGETVGRKVTILIELTAKRKATPADDAPEKAN